MNLGKPMRIKSRAQRALYQQLRFRAGSPTSGNLTCWLAPVNSGLSELVVPTLMGWWEGQRLYSAQTITALEAMGAVTVGPDQQAPDFLPKRSQHKRVRPITLVVADD